MMRIKDLNKTRLIISTILTVLVIGMLFVTLLATVDFDLTKVNWFDFCYSIANWMVGRTIYFPIGVDVGELNVEVVRLKETINKYRNLIFKKRVTKEVEAKIDYYNKINKIDAYLAYIDCKIVKAKGGKKSKKWIDKKNEVLEYLKCLQTKTEYTGDFNIDTIRIAHEHLDLGTCLSFGTASRSARSKYRINLQAEGIKKAIPSFMWMLVVSLVNGSITFISYGFTLQALFTFFIKLVLFILGCYSGITLGKNVVEEDKYQVLLNICSKLKEVMTDVEKDLGIVIDDDPVEINKQPVS